MQLVGIIGEYNPFHHGHLYHITQVKQAFPDAILVLVLNGYFLERGEVSLLSKEDKTRLALNYGIHLVLELPVLFGTQAADIFADKAIEILHAVGVTDLVFGSECNNPTILYELAKRQLSHDFQENVKHYLKQGVNYPTALSKTIDSSIREPNDLLGISYAKAILKHHYPIMIHTILRTNCYHADDDVGSIVSASTIRSRLKRKESIQDMVPLEVLDSLHEIDEERLWMLLRFRILTDSHLDAYLTVDEGIEHRLKKVALQANGYEEFVSLSKTKRYTYNKIRRMILHILLGITKKENDKTELSYLHVLGFDSRGQSYLNQIRKTLPLPLHPIPSTLYEFEKRAAYLYEILTNSSVQSYEFSNRPIIKGINSLFDK